jgi:3-deoxy-D-manno-octulosonic acid kinase
LIVNGVPRGVDGEQALRTPRGAMLVAAAAAASVRESGGEAVFDPRHWLARGGVVPAARGRGGAWFVRTGGDEWLLRHYRRGGLPGRVLADRYSWLGETRVRSFAEWRLTAHLHALGLPVPAPIAARYVRAGLTYRCDLITRRVPGAEPLSQRLSAAALPAAHWRAVGAAVGALHARGVDHADLNAHNILLDATGAVTVIDFDRGRLRATPAGERGAQGTGWMRGNLERLQRSLRKISHGGPPDRYGADDWRHFMAGYTAS